MDSIEKAVAPLRIEEIPTDVGTHTLVLDAEGAYVFSDAKPLPASHFRRVVACLNHCDGIPTKTLEEKSVPEYLASQTLMSGMHIEDGAVKIGLQGGACGIFANAFAAQFVGSKAINYVEATFTHPDTGDLLVNLQRVQGQTPHQLRAKAESQRDALLAALTPFLALERELHSDIRYTRAFAAAHAAIKEAKS